MSKQFKREDRYIVVKLSDLAKVPVNYHTALVQPLFSLQEHLPRREFLVIESDWPEFEPTWSAIERRVTGKSTLVDSREQFEHAYSEDNAVPVALLMSCRQGDSYSEPKVARAWYWWKRARAGVVVRIDMRDWPTCFDREITAAIEAAGVKVAT